MILRDIRKGIILTSIIIIATISLLLRMSYAAFSISESSEQTTIEFGDINLQICYSSDCNQDTQMLGNIIGTQTTGGVTSYIPQYPISDVDYDSVIPYKFIVENTGDLDLYLSLYLEPDLAATAPSISGSAALPNNGAVTGNGVTGTNQSYTQSFSNFVSQDQYGYFKVALIEENSDVPLVKTYDTIITDDNQLVGNISLDSGQSRTYLLYIWLSKEALLAEDALVNTNAIMGKYLVTDLSARGEYKPE